MRPPSRRPGGTPFVCRCARRATEDAAGRRSSGRHLSRPDDRRGRWRDPGVGAGRSRPLRLGAGRTHAGPAGGAAGPRRHDDRGEIGLRPRLRDRAATVAGHCAARGRPARRARPHLPRRPRGAARIPRSAGRPVLAAARRHGLALKLHADELDGSGGAELAVEVGASSADHLAGISPAGIRALAASETVAVLLPATLLFLGGRRQAPARRLLDAGAALALATDLNPGSSPTLSLPLVMALAVSQLGLRHAEVVNAVTVNAAAALGMVADRGQLAPGFRADIVVCDVADWRGGADWVGGDAVNARGAGGSGLERER